MRIGAVFPQTEIGGDPGVIREYVTAVEEMGFDHLVIYDHVIGASIENRPDWRGPYTSETMFHEPFVLFGYVAALTKRLELVTGVIILPQRQTALVAKQAAEVDVLSGGRMRLGVGVGWNEVEFESLNEDFHTRGRRLEEQVEVMRALWTQPVVTYTGKWHTINEAGLNPLPVQRPIPIWFGGVADAAMKRIARIGDGWMPQMPPNERARELVEQLRADIRAAGRPESAVGIEARLGLGQIRDEAGWESFAHGWRDLGATYLDLNTMGAGYTNVGQHLDALRRAQAVVEKIS
ncbi:MAG TPA: LLM class F420-dependent oxidoreductase [Ktedonobacterales bacterium]|jgi:probable F420-dependent oxidoreductase